MTTGPLLLGAALALAVAVAVLLSAAALGTGQAGLARLALVLSLTGAATLLLGAGLVRLIGRHVDTLQRRLALVNAAWRWSTASASAWRC